MLAHRAGVVSRCRNWVGALRRARSLALGLGGYSSRLVEVNTTWLANAARGGAVDHHEVGRFLALAVRRPRPAVLVEVGAVHLTQSAAHGAEALDVKFALALAGLRSGEAGAAVVGRSCVTIGQYPVGQVQPGGHRARLTFSQATHETSRSLQ